MAKGLQISAESLLANRGWRGIHQSCIWWGVTRGMCMRREGGGGGGERGECSVAAAGRGGLAPA